MFVRLLSVPLLALPVFLASCGKPEIRTYRVPKEPAMASVDAAAAHAAHVAAGITTSSAPASGAAGPSAGTAPGGGSMAGSTVTTAGGPGLTWTAPPHWKTKPASAMRKGSFAVPGEGGDADLSITAFPGNVGGDLANLNRWRGQINLPPVDQAGFEAAAQRIERNGLRMTVVDIAGTGAGAQRILGAMIPYEGATWFVKLGPAPDALVAAEKPAFLAFLDTIKPAPAAK